ncbi:MAG: hypothetical protein JWQ19_584 [Subtercola sp.]|nr:hypothetical protein [Subtercola sp.]
MLHFIDNQVWIGTTLVAYVMESPASRPLTIEGVDGHNWHDTTDMELLTRFVVVHAAEMLRNAAAHNIASNPITVSDPVCKLADIE